MIAMLSLAFLLSASVIVCFCFSDFCVRCRNRDFFLLGVLSEYDPFRQRFAIQRVMLMHVGRDVSNLHAREVIGHMKKKPMALQTNARPIAPVAM